MCGNGISALTEAPDLHEIFYTRDDVRTKPSEIRDLINHPCNVVFRHHESWSCVHTPGHGGDEILWKCALSVTEWEGTARVDAYLQAMQEALPILGAQIYQRYKAMNLPVMDGKKPFDGNQFSKKYDWL